MILVTTITSSEKKKKEILLNYITLVVSFFDVYTCVVCILYTHSTTLELRRKKICYL